MDRLYLKAVFKGGGCFGWDGRDIGRHHDRLLRRVREAMCIAKRPQLKGFSRVRWRAQTLAIAPNSKKFLSKARILVAH